LNGKLYAVYGRTGAGGWSTSIYVYDGSSWTNVNAPSIQRYDHKATVTSNGKMWSLGGYDGYGELNEVRSSEDGTNWNFVGNAAIEQIIKVAKMKVDSLLVKDFKSAVKTIIGSCNSIGIMVEGMRAADASKAVDAGKFDKEIKSESTEVSAEKKQMLKAQLSSTQEELNDIKNDLTLMVDYLVQRVNVGLGPSSVALSPDGKICYAANYFTNNVSVIQTPVD